MPGVTGREMKGWAFAKFGTNSWGVAASVTKGTRFMGDGGVKFQPTFVEDRSFGETFLGPSSTSETCADRCDAWRTSALRGLPLRPRSLGMGSPAAVTISTSAAGQTTSWQHIIDPPRRSTARAPRSRWTASSTSRKSPPAKIYGFGETSAKAGW
jgi:hypothetical protein